MHGALRVLRWVCFARSLGFAHGLVAGRGKVAFGATSSFGAASPLTAAVDGADGAAAVLDHAGGVAALDAACADGQGEAESEARLIACYADLRAQDLAPNFGAALEGPWPVAHAKVFDDADVSRLTGGLRLEALRPAQQGLFAAFKAVPADRVIRHEAGHFLLAYLLGCPVQGCVVAQGKTPGTVYFDPELNVALQSGKLGRSVIDRYSIVVMGGIAAEAMCFGSAEGGRDDEAQIVNFLTTTVGGPFGDRANVLNQARWAALNALLLLRTHRPQFDRLVDALTETRSAAQPPSFGAAVLAIDRR